MSSRQALLDYCRQHRPEAVLCRGWCLDGPGAARWGWYLHHPAGRKEYLAPTAGAALALLSRASSWYLAPWDNPDDEWQAGEDNWFATEQDAEEERLGRKEPEYWVAVERKAVST